MAAKHIFGIGAAIYNSVGAVLGPILGVKFQMIEWGNGSNYEQITPPPEIIAPLSSYYCVGGNA